MKLTIHKTWFVSRYFGRGWYPETWEGWVLSFSYVAFILLEYFVAPNEIVFVVGVAVTTMLYLLVVNKKSRKPDPKTDRKEGQWKAGKLHL